MEDLIKRSDVWNITAILHSEFITIEQEQILERIDEMVDGLPSADRPQGEWIEEEYKGRIYGIYRCQYKCFHCGYVPMHRGEPIIPTNRTLRFCPNCGARMFAKDTNVPNKKGVDDEVTTV